MVTHVVDHHVQGRECDQDLSRRGLARLLVVDDGDDELQDCATHEAAYQHAAATAPADDDDGVCDDGDKAESAQNVGHGEGVVDVCHGEEVRLVRCERVRGAAYIPALLKTSVKGAGRLTDNEHGARRGLQRHSADREDRPPPIHGILEHIPHPDLTSRLPLLVDRGLDLISLSAHVGARGPHALEGADAVVEAVLQDEPAGGFGDEEHSDGQESGDDVDYAEGYEVGGPVRALGSRPVDDGADEGALLQISLLAPADGLLPGGKSARRWCWSAGRGRTKEVKNWNTLKKRPRYLAGLVSWM